MLYNIYNLIVGVSPIGVANTLATCSCSGVWLTYLLAYFACVFRTPVFHRPTSSDVTEDSGLGCLTPRDYSSADELEDPQLRQDGQTLLSSSPPTTMWSYPLVQPTSVDYDSESDGGQSAQYSKCKSEVTQMCRPLCRLHIRARATRIVVWR